MKKTIENRYPHSATLFRFCKEALEIRYEGNVKVIDQDVGAILGYDPADCSHWKKGKKNIRSLGTLRNIADHLKIDERLLIDIASGRMDLEEAVFEFSGYGDFTLQGRSLENLKKEFFRNPARWQKDGTMRSFEELFDIDRQAVVRCAEEVLERGNFTEAPIYFPEIFQLFTNITLVENASLEKACEIITTGESTNLTTEVVFKGPEMRPYVRFLIAKAFFRHLCKTRNDAARKFVDAPDEVIDIQGNIFAGCLLVPSSLLRKEVERVDGSLDLITQLSSTFWVSKSLMNKRLRDYMEHLG